jgi:Cu(I)/Ag(I) efflux system membrane fusion protein
MKQNRVLVASLSLVALLWSCSGGKKQSSEAEHHEAMTATKEDTVSVIKPFDNVDASVKNQLRNFLADYFALNKALIEDNMDGAKVAAKKLAETVQQFEMTKLAGDQMSFYHAQEAKLNQGLKAISESSDIEEIREDLSVVSKGIYSLAKAFHPNESELYYQFCPMAKNGEGANWLSSEKEIENPYMGQRMLKCGRTQEVIAQLK